MATREQELHQAVQENNMNKVKQLLDSGISINAMFYGWTPLQLAIEKGLEDMAVLLIERGCDTTTLDQNNRSPFEDALLKKELKVVQQLLTNNRVAANTPLSSGDPPLCYAIEDGNPELVKVLLDYDAAADCTNKRNQSALYLACEEGEAEIVTQLLKRTKKVDQVHEKYNKFTPLLVAAANDHEDIVKKLLSVEGVTVDAQDGDGWTALWHAYSNSNDELSERLLKAGASADVVNKEGKTVVQEANENEDEDFVTLFNRYKKKSQSNSPRR